MTDRTRLTTVETVHEEGSWLFTVEDEYGVDEEVILVPCEDTDERSSSSSHSSSTRGKGVEAWVNRCTHEAQKLDRGFGAAMRDGEIVCPKHGSMFEACSGFCDNGEAADTTLVSVDVAVEDGEVFLVDEDRTFGHEGGADEGGADDGPDDVPGSSSHLSF